jgi:diacylglycerol kinase (ATP)
MTTHEKLLLIVNPIAGHGKSRTIVSSVAGALNLENVDYEIAYTRGKRHAEDLARGACHDGYSCVVAVGGDGTFGEVVNGVLTSDNPNVSVAVIPAGTGNDFVGGTSLFSGLGDCTQALITGRDMRIDAICIEDSSNMRRYGISSVGIGFDAYVIKRINELGSKKWGKLGYTFEAIRSLATFPPTQGKIVLDNIEHDLKDLWLLAVTNAKNFGGGMKVSPNALVNDEFLDCNYLSSVPRLNLIGLVFLVRQGKHLGRKGVVSQKIRSLTVHVPQGIPAHIDGDTVDVRYPLNVSVVPSALKLRVPLHKQE